MKSFLKILKIIAINLLVTVVGVVLVLAGYEVYLRFKVADPNQIKTVIDQPIYVSDLELGWAHKQNYEFAYFGNSFLNQFGQRSENSDAQKKILLLGDSFIFGMNVAQDQTVSADLQKKLDLKKWQVMNAGVIGYSINQELIYLKREFEKLKPQTVVLNFFVGNDLTEQRRNRTEKNEAGMPLKINDSEVTVNEQGVLTSVTRPPFNSLALADIFARWKEMKIQKKAYPGYTWAAFLAEDHPYYPADMDQLWNDYEKSLEIMANFLKEQKVNFVVVIIPMDVQVSKDYWGKYPNRVFEEQEFEERIPQVKFQEICARLKLNCLDLLPEFKKVADQKQLYFKMIDPHFDVAGNQLAADLIFDFLSSLNYLE